MMQHELQASELEKMSFFFDGNNFARLNLYRSMIFGLSFMVMMSALALPEAKEMHQLPRYARICVFSYRTPDVPLISPDNSMQHITWGDLDKRKYSLYREFQVKKDNNSSMTVTFVPEKDGRVVIALSSRPDRSKGMSEENQNRMLFCKVQSNDVEIKNGNFSETDKHGKVKFWWLAPEAQMLKTGNGNILSVYHSQLAGQIIEVKAGQPVTITVTVKAGEFIYAKDPEKPVSFNYGPWTLKIDPQTGTHVSLLWNGKNIADNKNRIDTVFLHADKAKAAKNTLESYVWNNSAGTLILKMENGCWSFDEIIIFAFAGNPNRLARKLKFRLNSAVDKDIKFHKVVFREFMGKHGQIFVPNSIAGDIRSIREIEDSPFRVKPYESHVDKIEIGSVVAAPHYSWPVIFETAPDLSAVLIVDSRMDTSKVQARVQKDHIISEAIMHTYGWADNDQIQETDNVVMEIFPGDAQQTLRKTFHRLYKDIGLKIPKDRPSQINRSVVYSFMPGGFYPYYNYDVYMDSSYNLFPRISDIGCNTLWVLPVNDCMSHTAYNPVKYTKIRGNSENYHKMVAEAHKLNMQVWQDIVPHGGGSQNGEIRKNSLNALAFNADGSINKIFCWDFNSPEWQNTIGVACDFFIKKHKVDGFRVDMPVSPPNWRKMDFPITENVPIGISTEYWKSQVANLNGKWPPPPSNRASLTVKGSRSIVRRIVDSTRRLTPENGVVLAESHETHFFDIADLLYDIKFRLLTFKLPELSSEERVKIVANYLTEQKYTDPCDGLRLRYLESHDTYPGRYWLGFNAANAIYPVIFFSKGVPMIYQDSSLGNGTFLKKLIQIRQTLPEMQYGDASYQQLKTDNSSIFTIYRSWNNLYSAVFINFSDKVEDVLFDIPGKMHQCSMYEMMSGKELKQPKIQLPPWGCAIVTWRNNKQCIPVSKHEPSTDKATIDLRPLLMRETNDKYIISGSYNLTVNKKNGLIENFENTIMATDVISSGRYNLACLKTKLIKQKKDKIVICAESEELRIKYSCTFAGVEIKATLKKRIDTERIGLYFSFPDAQRWQANCYEGLLDDLFTKQPFSRISSLLKLPSNYRYYSKFSPVIFDSMSTPLRSNFPVIRVYGKNIVDIIEKKKASNAMIFRKIGNKQELNIAFYFRKPDIDKQNQVKSFSILLKKGIGSLEFESTPVKYGDVSLSNKSHCWEVKNKHYSLQLNRAGGLIKKIIYKSNSFPVYNDLYSNKGFRPEKNHKYLFSAAFDGETNIDIQPESNGCRIRFISSLKARTAHYLVWNRIWSVIDYVFDGSHQFRMRCSILAQDPAITNPAEILYTFMMPDSILEEIAGTIDFKNPELGLSLKVIGTKKQKTNNKKSFSIPLISEGKIIPGKWYSYSAVFSFNDFGEPCKLSQIPPLDCHQDSMNIWDNLAGSYSLVNQSWIPFQEFMSSPYNWVYSQNTDFDLTNKYQNNKFSIKFSTKNSYSDASAGRFRIPLNIQPGSYRLSIKAKTEKGASQNITFRILMFLADGKTKTVNKTIPVNEDTWECIYLDFTIPDDSMRTQLSLNIDEEQNCGNVWCSEFNISRILPNF